MIDFTKYDSKKLLTWIWAWKEILQVQVRVLYQTEDYDNAVEEANKRGLKI